MAICQGLGLALAVGIGGPIAALFIAMMAALGSGIHPDGTDYGFLSETWFLVTLLAIVVVFMFARGREAMRGPSIAVLAAIGAIVAAASLAEEGEHGADRDRHRRRRRGVRGRTSRSRSSPARSTAPRATSRAARRPTRPTS